MSQPEMRLSGAQVIWVRWHGPTLRKPARYSVETEAGRKYYSKAKIEALPGPPIAAAARLHAEALGWGGKWVGGSSGLGRVFVFVQVSEGEG